MPVLLYCVADCFASLDLIGVAGSAVERIQESGVAVFCSEDRNPETWLRAPLRTSAKQFHRVQQELFRSAAILPFRFPTILESRDRVHAHIAEHAAEYASWLQRFASFAQMDIALSHAADVVPASGGEYLRSRQSRARTLESVAELLHALTSSVVAEWRCRSASSGMRCFALVERNRTEEFNEKIRTASISHGVSARVSGPWPVAEFIDLNMPGVKTLDRET